MWTCLKLRARVASAAVALSVICGLVACSRSPCPLCGTPLDGTLAVSGPSSTAHPGDIIHLTATLTLGDGTSRDVTHDTTWTSDGRVIIMTGPGTATAGAYGTETIRAWYPGALTVRHLIRVAPAGAWVLDGVVRTEAGLVVPDAVVEFTSQCGTVTTITDLWGRYALAARGATTMRVVKPGFLTSAVELIVDSDEEIDFTLRPAEGTQQTWTYRLSVVASPACVLPSEVQRRDYDARVEQTGDSLAVRLDGADFVAWAGDAGFTGSRTGDTLRFVIRATIDDGLNLIERIPGIGDVSYSGTATGTFDAAQFVAQFDGTIDVRPSSAGNVVALCQAADHRLEFVASGGR